MFVLDVLRHDIEQVPSICRLLNDTGCIGWRKFWHGDFTEDEVSKALKHLISERSVPVLIYDPQRKELVADDPSASPKPSLDDLWFRLNEKGRGKLEEWEPLVEAG